MGSVPITLNQILRTPLESVCPQHGSASCVLHNGTVKNQSPLFNREIEVNHGSGGALVYFCSVEAMP